MKKSYDASQFDDEEVDWLLSKPIGEIFGNAWYTGPGKFHQAPALLLVQLPKKLAGNDNLLVLVAENAAERRALECALDRPMTLLQTPFGAEFILPTHELQFVKSGLPNSNELQVMVYEPPRHGWPWLFIVIKEKNIDSGGEVLTRSRYKWAYCTSPGKVMERVNEIVAVFDKIYKH